MPKCMMCEVREATGKSRTGILLCDYCAKDIGLVKPIPLSDEDKKKNLRTRSRW